MFEEKYIKDNQNIVPYEQTKRYIKVKISEQAKPQKINYNAIIAAALSLVLAVGVTLIAKNPAPIKQYVGESALMQNVTYDTVYDSIDNFLQKQHYDYFTNAIVDGIELLTGGLARDDASPEAAEDIGTGTNGTNKGESSTTNNQVQGVDESDTVKNDGKYIYSANNGYIVITDTNNGDPKVVNRYYLNKEYAQIKGLFVNENRLAVILSRYSAYEVYASLVVLDITDKENITEIANKQQDGWYLNARMVEDTVYLLSNYGIREEIEQARPETFVPCVDNSAIAETDICVIEDFETPSYLVVSSINLENGEIIDNSAILGGAQNIYCNNENLFYTFSKHGKSEEDENIEYKTETTIVKLSLNGGKIKTEATGTVSGTPLNQFSMDEYENNLRIVTTVDVTKNVKTNNFVSSVESTSKNALYVLDKNLNQIGQIEDLAVGERVYSVRFDGAVGYFVTFRQVDPLFTVDLKDPTNPQILSELKIPGFSEYLHTYGKGRLFGFGKSATEQGSVTGLKISMFDVSDPSDVTELHLSSVPAEWSEASEDHKAIMVDPNKNIIAFIATDNYAKTRLFVYGYSEGNGFFKRTESFISKDNFYFGARFVWVNDHFYMVTKEGITTFNLDTFEKLSYLKF